MSDNINLTRRTDEPPARDGAALAGWPTVIPAEEVVALRGALGQLQAALDAVVRERDEARAEVERLTRQRDDARAEVQNMRLRAESDEALIDAARAHRNNLRAEIERTHALLKDPNAVAINMLRGVIALPSADQIRHIYQQTLEAKP